MTVSDLMMHPLARIDDTYDWLELNEVPKHCKNPLLKLDWDGKPAESIIKTLCNDDYLHFAAQFLLNVQLLPFQMVILHTLWTKRLPMLIASRGAGKSFIFAVYILLRLIFHPGCKVVIVGAGFRQARQVMEYMITIWDSSPILRDICKGSRTDGPRREIDRLEFRIGKSAAYAVPLGDGCLSPYSQMTYGNRFGTISDDVLKSEDGSIVIEDRSRDVWSNGKFRTSDEAYYNGRKPTKVVKTKRGYSFEGTHNHKMKVLRDGAIDWVRADEMKIGDMMLIDRSRRWHSGKIEESEAECRAYGLMVGKVHYGFQGAEFRQDWMNKWELEKCYAIDKCLTPKILGASREQMKACLQGLFSTNGSVQVANEKRGGVSVTVSFWNTSEKLVDQIHYILLHFGIISTKRFIQRKNANWNKEFQLSISGKDVEIFAREIGFSLLRKQKLLLEGLSAKTMANNSIGDSVPGVLGKMKEVAEKYSKVCKGETAASPNRIRAAKTASRKLIKAFLERYENCGDPFIDVLRELSNSDVYYDPVVSIEDSECDTYDIHVPDGHEYCANGFFSHNSKIRGLRGNYIIADEFASIPSAIFNVVVKGFGIVASDPVQKVKDAMTITKLKQMGAWTPELAEAQKNQGGGNQIVYGGTAFYAFNHFCEYWEKYKKIIESRGDKGIIKEMLGDDSVIQEGFDWRDFAVLRVPYSALPPGFLDPTMLAEAKSTVNNSQFLMEYGAVFPRDSDGFFKRSVIEACTTNNQVLTPAGHRVQFNCMRQGESHKSYVIAIDPARADDHAAIVVLEVNPDHRRVVYVWSINRKRFTKMKQQGLQSSDDYYVFLVRKIRDLMKLFNTQAIVMDSQGGGGTILEALGNKDLCQDNEQPIYQHIDEKEARYTDNLEGLHILELVNPTNDYNSEANHALLKDLEMKALLFPAFDVIELARAAEIDNINNLVFDSYEDLVEEIEAAKREITTIVCTATPTGKEHFDTPELKVEGQTRGRLRKDRYSAILYGNKYCRELANASVHAIEYKAVGGTRDTMSKTVNPVSQGMYQIIRPNKTIMTNKGWIKSCGVRARKG